MKAQGRVARFKLGDKLSLLFLLFCLMLWMDAFGASSGRKVFPLEAPEVSLKILLAMVLAADIAAPFLYGSILQGTGPLGTAILILILAGHSVLVAQHLRKLVRHFQRYEMNGDLITLVSPTGSRTVSANRLTVRRHWIARHWFWGLSPEGRDIKLPRPVPCDPFFEATERTGAVIEAEAWTKTHRGPQ